VEQVPKSEILMPVLANSGLIPSLSMKGHSPAFENSFESVNDN